MEAYRRYRSTYARGLKMTAEEVISSTDTAPEVLFELLEEAFEKVKENYDDIVKTCAEHEVEGHQDEFMKTRKLYIEARSVLLKRQSTSSGLSQSPVPSSQSSNLPKLSLPIFHGDVKEWLSFADLFAVSVVNEDSLSEAQKLQYLKMSLRGEAAQVLQHVQVTSGNFTDAWKLLENRFSDQREIIKQHITCLTSQHPLMSFSDVIKYVDSCKAAIQALRSLDISAFDAVMERLVFNRLSKEAMLQWVLSRKENSRSKPSFEDLLNFLEERARMESSTLLAIPEARPYAAAPARPMQQAQRLIKCSFCNQPHNTYTCKSFLNATVDDRSSTIKRNGACLNCLAPHRTDMCKSPSRCKQCGRKHHSLLHFPTKAAAPPVTLHSIPASSRSTPLLATAIVLVENVKLRALLDPGSTVNFITEAASKMLKLKPNPTVIPIRGLQGTQLGMTKGSVRLTLKSKNSSFSCPIEALVMDKITSNQPCSKIANTHHHLKNLVLADPTFDSPGPVDLLLGVEACQDVRGDFSERRKGPEGTPVAELTHLGWVVSGSCSQGSTEDHPTNYHIDSTHDLLQRFWELERVPQSSPWTEEESFCEQHFLSTTKRQDDGRFVVSMPQRSSPPTNTRPIALQRFNSLQRKFANNQEFCSAYSEVVNDYFQQGHAEFVPEDEVSHPAVYLPHHAVFKAAATTSLRVVFDGSASMAGLPSLNESLCNGPVIQDNLSTILTRFRLHKIAIVADIRQMYRQIKIVPEQRDMQRFLWLHAGRVKECRLTTVTFGIKPAPFMAIRTLQHLATIEAKNFPEASKIVLRDFYVDNLLTGADTVQDAELLVTSVNKLLTAGGFHLREWATTEPFILESLEESDIHNGEKTFGEVNTLGVRWSPQSDNFTIQTSITSHTKLTKRAFLAETSSIYDPLGWVSPITITAKILMQDLWRSSCDWDAIIPSKTASAWQNFKSELHHLSNCTIPRHIFINVSTIFFGFSDASEKAYAAVLYARTTIGSNFQVTLIASKTKVAPIKPLSLPRLELSAAVLLADLIEATRPAISITTCEAYTDSTVTLAWVTSHPSKWKTFERNRVAKIQEIIPPEQWHHVSSAENPADIACRGMAPADLIKSSMWWSGPEWIRSPVLSRQRPTAPPQQQQPTALHITAVPDDDLTVRFSSLTRLFRVYSYVLRFGSRKANFKGPISASELKNTSTVILQYVQKLYFKEEIKSLTKNLPLPSKSSILNLTPFLDEHGLLRVGGRIQNSKLPQQSRHPIVIPKSCNIGLLIMRQTHAETCHGGPSLMLSLTRQKYWIVNGLQLAKLVHRKCVLCTRFKKEIPQQLMGNLPSARVTPSRPFAHTGVDYAGPILIKSMLARGSKIWKAYIAVFVCLATKAVHIEAVSSLSTESFIATLKRFIARRGRPTSIMSDNGTNFVGADRELRREAASIHQSEAVNKMLSNNLIQWQFIPPRAPHHGGIWEAAVKSAKKHLIKTIGDTPLTFEELSTVLTQIEAILNSRPLTAIPSDHSYEALTPGHFLIGAPLLTAPEAEIEEVPQNRLSRYQLVTRIHQTFWKKWSRDYLHQLQQRRKWVHPRPNLKTGDIILLRQQNCLPLHWPMGRIVKLHPGSDGRVRIITVQTENSTFKRPITEVIQLPVDATDVEAGGLSENS